MVSPSSVSPVLKTTFSGKTPAGPRMPSPGFGDMTIIHEKLRTVSKPAPLTILASL